MPEERAVCTQHGSTYFIEQSALGVIEAKATGLVADGLYGKKPSRGVAARLIARVVVDLGLVPCKLSEIVAVSYGATLFGEKGLFVTTRIASEVRM
jgi:hypothetical protein